MAAWVARNVIPHEADVRAWLRRARIPQEDIDDLIQEAYCKLAELETIEHISRPDAYFFSVTRNLLMRRLRRARIVRIEAIAEIEAYIDGQESSPESHAGARLDLARLRVLLAELPERCRRIVELRKFEGYSQIEIAKMLNVTESVVENEVHHGMKSVLNAWRTADTRAAERLRAFESSEGLA